MGISQVYFKKVSEDSTSKSSSSNINIGIDQIPLDLILKLDLKIGDQIDVTRNEDGTISVKKKVVEESFSSWLNPSFEGESVLNSKVLH